MRCRIRDRDRIRDRIPIRDRIRVRDRGRIWERTQRWRGFPLRVHAYLLLGMLALPAAGCSGTPNDSNLGAPEVGMPADAAPSRDAAASRPRDAGVRVATDASPARESDAGLGPQTHVVRRSRRPQKATVTLLRVQSRSRSSLSAVAVRQRLRSHSIRRLSLCYQDFVRKSTRGNWGTAPKSVRLRISVSAQGRVASHRFVPPLPWLLRRCLDRSVQLWRFPEPKGQWGAPATAAFEIGLLLKRPGDRR